MLGFEIPQLQHAICALDKLFDPGFGLSKLLGCESEALDALLEEFQGRVEVEALGFELGDDLLEAFEIGFKGHEVKIIQARGGNDRSPIPAGR